jgi:hypothetical protein
LIGENSTVPYNTVPYRTVPYNTILIEFFSVVLYCNTFSYKLAQTPTAL